MLEHSAYVVGTLQFPQADVVPVLYAVKVQGVPNTNKKRD